MSTPTNNGGLKEWRTVAKGLYDALKTAGTRCCEISHKPKEYHAQTGLKCPAEQRILKAIADYQSLAARNQTTK